MNNLKLAVKVSGLNPEKIDIALLVGGLATLKEWSEKEVHLSALGMRSMCVEWRKKGQSLLKESSIKQESVIKI